MQTIKYIGLDVHKNSLSIATADQGRDAEVRYYGKIGNGVKCEVVAPSKIPRKSGDRLKNDKRDSLMLARLHRAGELTKVYVPKEEDEALRDLVRARADAQNAHKKAKQQLAALLLRYHIVFQGKSKWSKAYFNWLATISMSHPAQQITLQDYINTVNMCNNRVTQLTEQIQIFSKESRLYSLIKALQSMRGISLIGAATLASELGISAVLSIQRNSWLILGLSLRNNQVAINSAKDP